MLPLLWLALGGSLPLDEVVTKTAATMDRQPPHMVCHMRAEMDELDKKGAVQEHREMEFEETRRGQSTEKKILHATTNGKDTTADAQARAAEAAERAKKAPVGRAGQPAKGDFLSPYSQQGRPHYDFALLGEETLWGRRAYVIKVTSRDRRPDQADGTTWIDAEKFVVLKAELAPAKMPDKNIDWVKLQTQHTLHPSGFVLPSLFKIEGAGHFLFMKKAFRSTMRWSDCKVP
jgi:hypothetical protein